MFKQKKFIAYLATVFLLIVSMLIAACGGPSETKKDTAQNSKPIEITDVTGRTVTLKKPAERVVLQWSGAGGPFFTISALMGKDTPKVIAGMDTSLQDYRADMWKHFTAEMPELAKIPVVGTIGDKTFNAEQVVALNPDVIFIPVDLKDQYESDAKAKMDAAGIQTIYIDYHAEKLESHQKSIEAIGKALGKEERAAEISKFYTNRVTRVLDRVSKINKPKPTVYLEVGMNGPEEFGNSFSGNYSWGALATMAGADVITKDAIKKSSPINPEFVLEKNPDIIMIMGSYWPKKPTSMRLGFEATEDSSQALLKAFTTERQGWSDLKAVENKQVYSAHHGLPREVFDAAVFEYLAKTFYPEEFKDVDPEATLKEFYDKFLPFSYSGIWFMHMN
ncbi:periplasmic binding protein [Veillonella parvula DSM 2008]|uniref:Periplasmic binding protein n=1 Tax=Veillonella parvula (strain ATCC 10790 / DSM 2008 / CCUG 5123 / JCM 12972 / NCTC 11810 / Te3) TaxID=479436 RepID=A0ABF7PFP3_VEIPT|nr:ABC transporter substrate-binding protein [Veillonella parvula]ACZ23882.1 periplasmic binding protein [Veillonella parvula DSM 2008]QQB16836.1 ABC transporter substrate-binding protein [Veillonella parvula]SNU94318.1 ferrichrome/ferrioxamine B periplasmic transporter [Veillonella parvula]